MSNWNKLKTRFQERNRDLDAEFEQFLNESLSEDSVSSPRNKSPGLKKKDSKKLPETSSSKPWWESSVEDESSKDNILQSWFKKSATVREEDEGGAEEIPEDDGEKEKILAGGVTQEVQEKPEVPHDAGISVTMSKDSLDDGVKVDSDRDKLSVMESHDSVDEPKDEEENYSYTEPSGTPTSTPSPRREAQVGTGEEEFTENTETGMDTQKELQEKQEFFERLEKENKSNLDYGKLNEMLDEETSVTDQGRTGDLLQATGAELGNSIFNTTGIVAGDSAAQDNERLRGSPAKSLAKPSMLSKVSLMDSLESSMGTAQRQKIKQIRQKHIDIPVAEGTETQSFHDTIREENEDYSINIESGEDGGHENMKAENEGTGTDFLNTSAVNELADLQKALKAAQMVSTHDSGRLGPQDDLEDADGDGDGDVDGDGDPVALEKVKTSSDSLHQPSNILSGVSQLRPVIASTAEEESKRISLSPSVSVPQLNQTLPLPSDITCAAQEQQGIILSREAGQNYEKPVLGNLDIFQARQTGFPASSSKGFELPENEARTQSPDRGERSILADGLEHQVGNISHKNVGMASGFGQTAPDDNFGFSLQPVTELVDPHEESSEEDTPPPESLKGIKSIVEKRRQNNDGSAAGHVKGRKKGSPKVPTKTAKSGKTGVGERNYDVGRSRQRRLKGKKEIGGGTDTSGIVVGDDGDRSRFGWRNTNSRTSTPSRGKRGITVKEKKEKQAKSPKKPSKGADQASPAQLMASVESFANYLNTFVHRGENDKDTSPGDWFEENEDDRLLVESLAAKRLSREQALQKEVEHWRLMWHEERKQCEKLVDELEEKDKEWKRREKNLSLEYKKEINDLKQKVFVLESKLKDINAEADVKKRVAKGGSLKEMSTEELRKLEKEIREQDQLLTGYQQENERLYKDLKEVQVKAKTAETQMFKENQKLASDVASLREQLERKEGTFGAAGAAALGAERIHQLHSQVQIMKSNEQEMRKEIDGLENERRMLQKEKKNLERERDMAVERANQVQGTNSQALHDLASTHAADVERLNRKLRWYVENQELLDKDAASLKKKDEEILELRDLVQRLEAERGQTTMEKDRKEKERALDAKRIQDLERQVREMEQIIKRRYPNSIPALIYAASSTPGDGKPVKPEDSPKKANTPSYAFLENRVKKLNRELEEREEEWNRSFRVLEQKYNAMQMEYECHVKELQKELDDARENVTSNTQTRAHITTLEKDLEATRERNERKTQQLNEEIRVLREALRANKTEAAQTESKALKTKRSKREAKSVQKSLVIDEDREFGLKNLNEECARKDQVIEELTATCSHLQRQREEMLAEKEFVDSRKSVQKNLEERLDVVSTENRQLRDQLSQMSVEMDQQRVRYQGSLAEVERMARQEREASHDELRSLRSQHKKELDSAREEYAAQHSRSKMAEMSNKIASLEIVIERLKDKLTRSAETEAELASKKVHEQVLKQEINQLKSGLKKAKQFHTPEMQHYAQLDDKIVAMEARHGQRERELQSIIHKMRITADVEKDEVLSKWRNLLRKKTEETERFRAELDGILSVLEQLRRQGVIIPSTKIEDLHY